MSKIATATFLGLSDPTDELTRQLPISSRTVGGGRGSLFGGVGLAAGIIAIEDAADKRAVWATGQYVSTVFPPAEMDLTIELPAVGHTVTQGRVIGRCAGKEIITVIGAAGQRREDVRGMWERCPQAPPPEECAGVERSVDFDSIHQHVDVRMARGMFGFTGSGALSGDHRSLLWARIPGVSVDAAALAIIADYSPSALGNALGHITHLTSLDNTIRFADLADDDTDWVLCDTRIEFVGNGFAHGSCSLWSQAGALLATCSQSMTVMLPKD